MRDSRAVATRKSVSPNRGEREVQYGQKKLIISTTTMTAKKKKRVNLSQRGRRRELEKPKNDINVCGVSGGVVRVSYEKA